MAVKYFHHPKQFKLESGRVLHELTIAFHTYGTLNADRSNVIWVCHALTANSDAQEWWPGIVGDGYVYDTSRYFIVCANILGSHYGTTSPLSVNPDTGNKYYRLFPDVTIRDMVKAHQLLAAYLGINTIQVLTGGSVGGQQALEWAIEEPSRIKNLILLATNASHSPWGIAFNEAQRLAIKADRTFYSDSDNGGAKGLKAARTIALLSYRNGYTYNKTQTESDTELTDDYKAASYQRYQGDKLVKRFNAYSYYYLTKAMDSHHVGRGRGGAEKALLSVTANTLVIGITTDLLFPVEEQKFLANHIANAQYAEINSFYGHDGFLIEPKKITAVIQQFFAFDNTLSKNESAIQQATDTKH